MFVVVAVVVGVGEVGVVVVVFGLLGFVDLVLCIVSWVIINISLGFCCMCSNIS